MNADKVAEDMLDAALPILKDSKEKIQEFVYHEFDKLAKNARFIRYQTEVENWTEERAKKHFQMNILATQTALLTVEGLGLIAVERAINAALQAVREPINLAVGFPLV